MKKEKKPLLFRIISKIIQTFFGKNEFLGIENMPDEPSVYVANHVKMGGPLINHFYFPSKKRIWCIGDMMNLKDAPSYSYQDFWSNKPKIVRPIYKVLSYILAPALVYAMKNADTIAVYKDARLMKTYRDTMNYLDKDHNIVVFPEYGEKYNEIINDFLDKYIDVAKLYYKKTGKCIKFVPMYHAPMIRKSIIGTPILFNPEGDIKEERLRINSYLKEEITKLAKTLPRHKVVPYENIKKKHYKWSKDEEIVK